MDRLGGEEKKKNKRLKKGEPPHMGGVLKIFSLLLFI